MDFLRRLNRQYIEELAEVEQRAVARPIADTKVAEERSPVGERRKIKMKSDRESDDDDGPERSSIELS